MGVVPFNVDIHSNRLYKSRVMRKSVFCVCKNEGADQLHSNSAADQCLCFRYKDNTIPTEMSLLKLSSEKYCPT